MEKLVLEYADAMTQTPVEVPEALFAKLREKFTDAQLVELTATVAWENYRARFDHAFGVEAEGLQRGATARYQCARRVRLRFIPRVEALSLARNRLLVYSRGVTPKTRERFDLRGPRAFIGSDTCLCWITFDSCASARARRA